MESITKRMNGKKTWALAALLSLSLGAAAAEAQNPITSCGTLMSPGSFKLVGNLSGANCLVVAANFVTIDLAGFRIFGTGAGAGITDNGIAREGTVVRNGTTTNLATGINLGASTDTLIERVRAVGNTGNGIVVGLGSIVTGNTANDNGGTGIVASAGNTITGNTASDNGTNGIVAAAGSTITGNIANINVNRGIDVTCPSNVLENTATGNLGGNLVLTVPLLAAACNSANNVAP